MTKSIHLWTDGSSVNSGKKDVGCGGYGFVLLYGDFNHLSDDDLKTKYCDDKYMLTGFKGFTNTTNQREEIRAMAEGLKRINKYDIPIKIFSDSAYVLNGLQQRWFDKWRINGWKNSKKQPVENREQWEDLLSAIESNMLFVSYQKVKSHTGIYYNELADQLANKGLDQARGRI